MSRPVRYSARLPQTLVAVLLPAILCLVAGCAVSQPVLQTPGRQAPLPSGYPRISEDAAAQVKEVGQVPVVMPYSVAWSPDGRWLAAGNLGGINVYEARDPSKTWEVSTHGAPLKLAFSPDGTLLAAMFADSSDVKMFDTKTGQEGAVFSGHRGRVYALAFSPDGSRLAIASGDGVRLWDVGSGQEVGTLAESDGEWGLAFSPDGELLALGDCLGTVQVREVRTGRQVMESKGHAAIVFAVAFSPDGTLLAAATCSALEQNGGRCSAGTIVLWNTRTWRQERTLQGHRGVAGDVAFSPDGTLLASTSEDGTIRLWEGRSGKELRVVATPIGFAVSLAFSPDGGLLASASATDVSVRLWGIAEE